ncbi:hypothetical protein GCM10027180_38820 [Microbulbifer echini]
MSLAFCAGFVVSSFHDGDVGPAAKLWFVAFCIYVPIYVAKANESGSIHVPASGGSFDVLKGENIVGFRLTQFIYLAISIVGFVASIKSYI